MTDNISRMYRMFNIDKVFYVSDDITDNLNLNSIKEDYPPFTDSKQLELIKWLALNFSQSSILHIDRWTSGKVRFALDKEKYTEPYYDSDYAYGDKDFSQALAGLVCELWEDLTDMQREEVRGILQ